jgi:hypothetical protein
LGIFSFYRMNWGYFLFTGWIEGIFFLQDELRVFSFYGMNWGYFLFTGWIRENLFSWRSMLAGISESIKYYYTRHCNICQKSSRVLKVTTRRPDQFNQRRMFWGLSNRESEKLKWTQIASAAVWYWVVQNIFQVFMWNLSFRPHKLHDGDVSPLLWLNRIGGVMVGVLVW